MDKHGDIYYQPNHLWKGQKAIRKLRELSKEKPSVINIFPKAFFIEFVFFYEFPDFFVSFKVLSGNSSHFISISSKDLFLLCLFKMDYDNMSVVDLKALVRENRLRGCSGMRKTNLITLLRNNQPALLCDLAHDIPQDLPSSTTTFS